jgi:hypothetical protein
MAPALILLVLVGIPAAVFLISLWLRAQERQRILQALSSAAEKGASLPQEHVAALLAGVHQPPRVARQQIPTHLRDTRRGTLLLALTISIVLIGGAVGALIHAQGEPVGFNVFLIIAAVGGIPGAIGVAYLLLARAARHEQRRAD